MSSLGFIALAMRVYMAAVTPLKLMVRDSASDLLTGKFRMHNT